MTESRPPAAPRRAASRSAEQVGDNPFARPLPPGMGRPNGSARPGAHAEPDDASSRVGARRAPETRRPAASRSALAAATARRANPGDPDSRIPLMAPPAWQVEGLRRDDEPVAEATKQRGLPGWLALVVLLAITGVGGLIDAVAGASIKGTFAIGLVVGGLVAILLVRRSAMFPIVVAPPLVYFIASAVLLAVRSGGFSNRSVLIDAATNWLVYGFPAIAGASAVVLIVAGIRMLLRR